MTDVTFEEEAVALFQAQLALPATSATVQKMINGLHERMSPYDKFRAVCVIDGITYRSENLSREEAIRVATNRAPGFARVEGAVFDAKPDDIYWSEV